MAHFAELDENNLVVQVRPGPDSDTEEAITARTGIVHKQCSYNTYRNVHALGGTPFRKNFASVGYRYDQTKDAFIPPRPFTSWTLNEETCLWEAPVAYPDDGQKYLWNEETQQWDLDERTYSWNEETQEWDLNE